MSDVSLFIPSLLYELLNVHVFVCITTLHLHKERTKERPLARGDITPIQAFGFLGVQLTAGLGILLQLNWYR